MRGILVLVFLAIWPYFIFAQETFNIKKAPFCSDKYDEFSPVFYKNGLVFCSNQNFGIMNYTTMQNEGLFSINYFDTTRQKNKDVKPLSKSLVSKLNDGPATFSPGGDTIYFSRNILIDGNVNEISGNRNKLGIFYSVLEGNKWSDAREMRFNTDSYNATTPYLSPDGKRLYFASDKPDGFGGSDLFFCEWKDGYWGNPVNLGPVINTEGDEAYPFVSSSGEIFFSSDGHQGLGGKDIFYSRFADSAWTPPVRLDPPINSEKDDFGLIADESFSRGYFSSDRGRSVDIYSFRTNTIQFLYCSEQKESTYCFSFPDDMSTDIDPINLQFQWDFGDGTNDAGYVVEHCFPGPGQYTVKQNIIEKKTGRLVHNKITLSLDLRDVEQPYITVSPLSSEGDSLMLDATKSNLPGKSILSYFWDFGDGKRATGGTVDHYYKANGEYVVKLGLKSKDNTSGRVFQECISKRITVPGTFTDTTGKDTSAVSLAGLLKSGNILADTVSSTSQDLDRKAIFQVVLLSSSAQKSIDDKSFSKLIPKYTVREVSDSQENIFRYIIDEGVNFMDVYPSFADAVALGFKNAIIETFVPSDSAESELWNIKRTYGTSSDAMFTGQESRLRYGNIPVLDQLAIFMKKYPESIIKIEVHTDNTSSSGSDLILSSNRAKSIIEYLLKKGINGNRLIPSGYGSVRPVASNYSEADRKKNRRIDFVIIK